MRYSSVLALAIAGCSTNTVQPGAGLHDPSPGPGTTAVPGTAGEPSAPGATGAANAPDVSGSTSASAGAPESTPSFVAVPGTTQAHSRPNPARAQGAIDPPAAGGNVSEIRLERHRVVNGFAEVSPIHREVCNGSSVWWAEGIDVRFYVPTSSTRPATDDCWNPPLPTAPTTPEASPEPTGLHLRRATMHVATGQPVFFEDGTRAGETVRPQPIIGDYEQVGELLCDRLGERVHLCFRVADVVEEPLPGPP